MTYCIYHIPGKKIGVTNNPKERVTCEQGYTEDEYDILAMSDDIDYISDLEIKLQQQYGYRVDRQLYKNLPQFETGSKTMNINITEATTTFPCPVNKLKGRLKDEIGMKWETDHGDFNITNESIDWIMSNVKSSMYNQERCYIYNRKFAKFGKDCTYKDCTYKTNTGAMKIGGNKFKPTSHEQCHLENRFDNIRDWADERGLYEGGDTKTQYLKLMEEAGELGRAILKDDDDEFIDAIGDMVVVLTNLAELGGVSIEHCIDTAYDVISKRTGKMQNGTFVKDTL